MYTLAPRPAGWRARSLDGDDATSLRSDINIIRHSPSPFSLFAPHCWRHWRVLLWGYGNARRLYRHLQRHPYRAGREGGTSRLLLPSPITRDGRTMVRLAPLRAPKMRAPKRFARRRTGTMAAGVSAVQLCLPAPHLPRRGTNSTRSIWSDNSARGTWPAIRGRAPRKGASAATLRTCIASSSKPCACGTGGRSLEIAWSARGGETRTGSTAVSCR